MPFRLAINLCQPVAVMFGGRHPEDKETWLIYQEVKLFLVLVQDDSQLIFQLTIL